MVPDKQKKTQKKYVTRARSKKNKGGGKLSKEPEEDSSDSDSTVEEISRSSITEEINYKSMIMEISGYASKYLPEKDKVNQILICGRLDALIDMHKARLEDLNSVNDELNRTKEKLSSMKMKYTTKERKMDVLKAIINAHGYIGHMESVLFPEWLIGLENVGRCMKWQIALELNLSPELKFLHMQLKILNLSVSTIASAITTAWGDISNMLHPVRAVKDMDDEMWSDFFNKIKIYDEPHKLSLKLVLKPVTRGEPLSVESSVLADDTLSYYVLDIKGPKPKDTADNPEKKLNTSDVEALIGEYTSVKTLIQHTDDDRILDRFHALVGPLTYDRLVQIKENIKLRTGIFIYNYKAKGF